MRDRILLSLPASVILDRAFGVEITLGERFFGVGASVRGDLRDRVERLLGTVDVERERVDVTEFRQLLGSDGAVVLPAID